MGNLNNTVNSVQSKIALSGIVNDTVITSFTINADVISICCGNSTLSP